LQHECLMQLRVYHPHGSIAADTFDLDASVNLILDSGSTHWVAVEYPASVCMLGVRQVEDGLALGSSSFAIVVPSYLVGGAGAE
jgi:hypothetical protein